MEQKETESLPVQELLKSAQEARKKAYAPYSHFTVGAAVLTAENRIYTGCNIENAAYSPGICAERTAVCKAVSEGKRKFSAIAIVGGGEGGKPSGYVFPCGVCRQVLREFTDPEHFYVIVGKDEQDYRIYSLSRLLPESFGPDSLLSP